MAAQGFWHALSFFRAIFSPSVYFRGQVGDGREKALLATVLSEAEQGNAQAVMKAVDAFAQRTWLMNVGDEKGVLLDIALKSCNAKIALELGTYCGYSAVRIASQLEQPGSKLVSVEMSAANANIAKQIIEHAGLSSKVQIVQGLLNQRLDEVANILKDLNAEFFDFIFIDHDKGSYLSDMLLLKGRGYIRKGTVVIADNITIPGAPKYRRYMKSHPEEFDSVEHKCRFEYLRWLPDSMITSTCKA